MSIFSQPCVRRGVSSRRPRIAKSHVDRNQLALVLVAGLLASGSANAQINFQNTTNSAIGTFLTETWGASVGDYNGDFWPDIFVGNHRQRPTLYRNNGDGTFTDVILQVDRTQVMLNNRFIDHHGAAWADFDADGDDDLQASTNGAADGYLGVSDGTFLFDEAASRGTEDDDSGWSVSWFDVNKDNSIDLGRWSFDNSDILNQSASNTFSSGPAIGCMNTNYGQIADVTNDGNTDLICGPDGTFPRAIYDYSSGTLQSVSTSNGIVIGNNLDTVIADFDGDLENEILSVRGALFPNQAASVSSNRAEAFMDAALAQGNATYNFSASSAVTFTVYGRNVNGVATTVSPGTTITLNAGGINNDGRIDVSSSGNQWTVTTRSTVYAAVYIVMTSSGVISNVQVDANSLRAVDFPILPRYLNRSGSSNWQNASAAAGFNLAELCSGVVAADFDNDMDLDVYMSCRGSVENIPNRMYRNNGNGTFTRIGGFGAEGPLGVGLQAAVGSAENAVTLDYDNNGYIDLFVTNGLQEQPLRVGGPHTIFRNLGSGNNWIQMKLVGQGDNAPAVGARVVASAGGTDQVREQNGGYHRWSQNDQRIHFGLANNSTVDLTIDWPSGATETYTGVQANAHYVVTEGVGVTPITPGAVGGFPAPTSSDVCGAPVYLTDLDFGAFIYQTNCGSSSWQVRVTGGQVGSTFNGRIVAGNGGSISSLSGVNLESNDTLTGTSSLVDFSLATGAGGLDGFNVNLVGDVCFVIDSPSNARTMVGSVHLPVPSTGWNPVTRQACVPGGGGGVATLSIADTSVNEGAGPAQFIVTRSGNTSSTVSFVVATQASGTATPGSDFYGRGQSYTLGSGQTSANFDVTIVDDGTTESTETFGARILSPSGATITDGNATASIIDNDSGGGGATLSIADTAVDEDAGPASFTVTRSGDTSTTVSFVVATVANGSATPGSDFYGRSQSYTLGAGQTTATFDVIVVDDAATESTEDFGARIISPSGASVTDGNATATISDDDSGGGGAPSLSIADVTVNESSGVATMTVTLSQAASSNVTVRASTAAETALGGQDYYGFTRTLTIAAGSISATTDVTILNDTTSESTETFVVRLYSPTGATISDSTGRVTISDDD